MDTIILLHAQIGTLVPAFVYFLMAANSCDPTNEHIYMHSNIPILTRLRPNHK